MSCFVSTVISFLGAGQGVLYLIKVWTVQEYEVPKMSSFVVVLLFKWKSLLS